LCEVAWLACRAVCPLDEASGQHTPRRAACFWRRAATVVLAGEVIRSLRDARTTPQRPVLAGYRILTRATQLH